jgi:hypothetical protein
MNKFLFFIMILTSLIGVSCQKEIIPTQGNLGKESLPSDVIKEINSAMSGISIQNAKKGSSVTYEDTLRVELGSVHLTKVTKKALNDIVSVTDNLKYGPYLNYLLGEHWVKFDYSSGSQIDEKVSENDLPSYLLPSTNALSLNATTNICDGIDDQVNFDGSKYDCTKYFNLKSESRLITPPSTVQQKSNCMNLPNCMLTVQHIEFDQVKWKGGASIDRLSISEDISKEIPDLMYVFDAANGTWSYETSPVTSLCYKGLLPVQGTKYIITQCKYLTDFDLGAP